MRKTDKNRLKQGFHKMAFEQSLSCLKLGRIADKDAKSSSACPEV